MRFARTPSRRLEQPTRLGSSRNQRSCGGVAGTFLLLATATAHAEEPDGEVIVVTGTREETPRQASPVTTEVIDRQRLAESGAQTAAEALAMRPGMFIDRGVGGTPGLTMQGLGPQYSLILVDGARQIGRTDGSLDLDRFAVEDLEQIEIVRGPSSVLYGSDALGGVVNLVTRAPREGVGADALARIDGRLGYELRGRLAAGTRGTAGSVTASYRTAGAVLAEPGASPATAFDAYDDKHVTGHAIHRRGEAWRFDAGADYVLRDLQGVTSQGTGAVLDRRNLVETGSGSLGARYAGERTAIRIESDASVYRDQFLSDQRSGSALDQYQDTDETLLEARAQVAHSLAAHGLLIGVEGLRETLASDRLVEAGDRERGAIYAQDQIAIGERGVIVPAARLDLDTQFGAHATPRLATRWELAGGVVARASIGMGYRAPSFKELLLSFSNPGAGYVVEGNPDLQPETSHSVQAGAEWRVTPWLWLGADTYANRLRDMIFVIARGDAGTGTLRFSYDNIGRARTAGAEGYAIATRGRAGIELGYAFSSTRDLDAGRALEGVPRHRVTATARWRDAGEGLDAFATFVLTGERPFYPMEGVTTHTPRRHELRARIAKRFENGLGGFLGADNLLGSGGSELDRIAPRTFYAGMEVHL